MEECAGEGGGRNKIGEKNDLVELHCGSDDCGEWEEEGGCKGKGDGGR